MYMTFHQVKRNDQILIEIVKMDNEIIATTKNIFLVNLVLEHGIIRSKGNNGIYYEQKRNRRVQE